jgi:type IV pilus assembly protein PilE
VKNHSTNVKRGFTLIELMVTVAIVGILVAVALPSYTQYVMRGKIQEATTNLLAMRTKMEQYYQDNRTYVGACVTGTVAPLPTGLKYFTFTCTPTPTATTYTVVATGGISLGDQSMAGFTYTINEANTRATVAVPTGWTLPATSCWALKKDGSC